MEDVKEINVFVSADNLLEEGEVPYYWLHESEELHGWVKVHSASISIPRPTAAQLRPIQVAAFQEAIREVRVEAERKIVELRQRLEELLAIEHSPELPKGGW